MNVTSNGLKMAGSLVTMPLALHYLGAERFGVWITLTSLLVLVTLGDFGVGNGLINAIATAHGADDRISAQTYVSSAFIIALLFSAVLLIVLFTVATTMPWEGVFHLSSPIAIAEVGPSVKLLVLCIVIHVPLAVLTKVRVGSQEIYINNLWDMLGAVLGLGALAMLIFCQASLPWMVCAEASGSAIAMMGNLGRLFLVEHPWLRPSLRCVRIDAARELLNQGLLFFVLAIIGIAAFYSDNFLAIWVCGPEAAGLYAICAKLFAPGRLIAGTLLGPLWPAYGEAIARGDIAWVRRTFMASIIFGNLAVLPLAAVGFFWGDEIASFWMRRPIAFGYGLLSGMALWVLLQTLGAGMSIFLNAASVILVQLPISITFAVVGVIVKVILASRFGPAGIVWGTILAFSGISLMPYAWLVRRHLGSGLIIRART
jgi:O-antigen/teichoic acid export membrane protein